MILVSYSENSKDYRLYDPDRNEVVICRDVVFEKAAETDKEEATIIVNSEVPDSVGEKQIGSNKIENENQEQSVESFDISERSNSGEEVSDQEYISESDSFDSARGEAGME